MNAQIFSSLKVLASVSVLALAAGCAAPSGDAGDNAAQGDQGAEQDLTAAAVTKLPATAALKDASFADLRTLYGATTYDYQDIQDTSAFSFKGSASMSDADALAVAKAVAKSAGYGSVHQYTLNAAGTPKRLAKLANTLAQAICASGDDTNTPKLVTAMTAAFSLPGKTPGGAIKVFSAIGPGDDHDGDNQDREAIFVDVATGQALVLQGQSIDM